jgi:hypothetical protein
MELLTEGHWRKVEPIDQNIPCQEQPVNEEVGDEDPWTPLFVHHPCYDTQVWKLLPERGSNFDFEHSYGRSHQQRGPVL